MSDPRRDLAQCRARLSQLRAATTDRIATLVDTFDEIVDAVADVATDDEHDPEGHTIAWERQQVAALRDEAVATLANLASAEQRLDAGTYGLCIVCGRDISRDRLDALPATPTCVGCAV